MKYLAAVLLLIGSVACGQSKKAPLFVEASKSVVPVNSIELEAPLEHSTAHCACEFTEDGKLMTCTPINACVEEIMRKMADTEPIEVPAIQEPDYEHYHYDSRCADCNGMCKASDWHACPVPTKAGCPKKRGPQILEQDSDGAWWCRKVQP